MFNKYHLISLLFFALWISNQPTCQAQNIVSFEFQINPGYAWIGAKMPSGLTSFDSKGAISFGGGFLTNLHFDKKTGISTGLLFKSYKSTFSGKEYQISFNSIDGEGDAYIRNVTGSQISEVSSLSCIRIPIQFFYTFQITRDISFVAELGPGISIPLKKECQGSGTFTYTGLYPQYNNVVLADIPPYGFNSNVPVDLKDKLKTNFAFVDAGLSAGVVFSITRYWKFHTSVNYNRSLTRIIKSSYSSDYHISNELGSYYSFINNAHSAASDFYISFGIRKVILY
jgi:hypothetical protein